MSLQKTPRRAKSQEEKNRERQKFTVTPYQFTEHVKGITSRLRELFAVFGKVHSAAGKKKELVWTGPKGEQIVVTKQDCKHMASDLIAYVLELSKYYKFSKMKKKRSGSNKGKGPQLNPRLFKENLINFFDEAARTGRLLNANGLPVAQSDGTFETFFSQTMAYNGTVSSLFYIYVQSNPGLKYTESQLKDELLRRQSSGLAVDPDDFKGGKINMAADPLFMKHFGDVLKVIAQSYINNPRFKKAVIDQKTGQIKKEARKKQFDASLFTNTSFNSIISACEVKEQELTAQDKADLLSQDPGMAVDYNLAATIRKGWTVRNSGASKAVPSTTIPTSPRNRRVQ